MALTKDIITRFQIEASYWKLAEQKINWTDKLMDIRIDGFTAKANRDAGAPALEQRSYYNIPLSYPSTDGTIIGITPDTNVVKLTYDIIKLQPEFEGATDN